MEESELTTNYYLSIANPQFDESLKRYESDILAACDFFNEASSTARTPKSLKILEFNDTYITVELTSDTDSSAKSLRLFTKYLLDNSMLGHYAYHTTLFKSIKIASPAVTRDASENVEVSVMKNMTRLLISELPDKDEYFDIINELFNKSLDMEPQCRKRYLNSVRDYIKFKADWLGH